MADTWLTFWQEKNAFDDLMNVNYAYFLKKVEQYVQPSAGDVVLDIGSGPGHLEDAWHHRVKEIHGVDISVRYNEMVREKHKRHPNVVVHDLPADNYLDLGMLQGKQFNIIVVMSVLQYYRSKEEIIVLLKNIKKLAAPGSELLLCDLMVQSSFLKEIFQILKDAVKEGKLISILSLFVKLRFSKYYTIKKQAGFLVLSNEEWMDIIQQLNLDAQFIKEPITLQKSRKSIRVQY